MANNRNVEFFYVGNPEDEATISNNQSSILAMVGAAVLKKADSAPSGLPATVTPLGTFFLDLSAGVDIESERKDSRKNLNLRKLLRVLKPNSEIHPLLMTTQVVEGAKKQLADNQSKLKETQEALQALQ